jgi:hypothetical protein
MHGDEGEEGTGKGAANSIPKFEIGATKPRRDLRWVQERPRQMSKTAIMATTAVKGRQIQRRDDSFAPSRHSQDCSQLLGMNTAELLLRHSGSETLFLGIFSLPAWSSLFYFTFFHRSLSHAKEIAISQASSELGADKYREVVIR